MGTETINILTLPVDLLQQILYHAVFSGVSYELFRIDTGVRNRVFVKLKPFDCRYPNQCLLATKPSVLFSVCSIFHGEGAAILYKSILPDLHYSEDHERAPRFLSTIGPHNAAFIRCMRISLGILDGTLPRCVFADMLHMIKRDFVNLEKLILVYPLQEEENEFYARTGLDPGVVQAERIVAVGPALRSLRGLSVVVEKAAATSASNEERELVPLVEYTDLQNPQQHAEGSSTAASSFASWSLLPEKVQRKVIEFSALPPDRLIHPLLATDTFPETRTIMPLLLTSKDISRVTEDVVYRGAIFASCLRKDRAAMYTFFQKRTLQQAQMIERYNINGLDHWIDRRLSKFLKSHCPNARDMEHTFRHTMSVNPCWNVDWAS